MKPSKDGPIPEGAVVDAIQAVIVLDQLHHWHATRINSESGRRGHCVKLRHGGRVVEASRSSFVGAVNAALDKLRDKSGPTLRLAGGRS